MRLPQLVAAVLFFSGCLTVTARGQVSPPEPGTRVRLTIPCPGDQLRPGAGRGACQLKGTLVGKPGDSVNVNVEGSPISYAWSDISRLEVSRGQRTYWLAGAGIGFLAGAGATWLAVNTGGSTALCDRSANQDALSSTECFGLVVVGGVVGGGVGAIIGNAIKGERWEDFPLGRVEAGPIQGGAGIGVSWNVAF